MIGVPQAVEEFLSIRFSRYGGFVQLFFNRVGFQTERFTPQLLLLLLFGIIVRLFRSANQKIANLATNPGMPVVGEDHIAHFIMGLAFASGIAALDAKMSKIATGKICFLGQPLDEFSLDYWRVRIRPSGGCFVIF
jgi:hypothetical protein